MDIIPLTPKPSPRVIITGYSTLLGLCILREFCLKKSHIIIISNSFENEKIDNQFMLDLGAKEVIIEYIDYSSKNDWNKIINIAINKWNGIDYLIYFDSIYYENSFIFRENECNEVKQIMDINFTFPILAISACIKQLRLSKGQIALLIAPAEGPGVIGTSLYMASKRALESYASNFNNSEKDVGITCIYSGKVIEHEFEKQRSSRIADSLKHAVMDSIIYKETKCTMATRERSNTIRQIGEDGIFANGIPTLEPPQIKISPIDSSSPLIKLVMENNKIGFRNMIKSVKNQQLIDLICSGDIHGRNALHYSCYLGLWDYVMNMLKSNKRKLLNVVDNYNWTPLHFSSFGGHLRLTKKLLADSADPNALTLSGMSCLHFLARLDPGNDPKIISRYQLTLKRFIQLGADINQRNVNWVTPLHEAAAYRSPVAVSFIIQNDGDVHRKTKTTKETPLQYAMKPQNKTVVKLLLEAGSDPIGCFDIAPPNLLPKLEEYREKNRIPHSNLDDIDEKPPIYVNKLEDFEEYEQKLLNKSGLLENIDTLYENWETLLYVLRFLLHKRFKIKKKKRRKNKKEKEESISQESYDNNKIIQTTINSKSRADYKLNLEEATTEFISSGNPQKLFKLGKQIGRGGFGSVFTAKRCNRTYAIKKLSHLSDKEKWSNFDEIFFLKTLEHPGIVQYYATYAFRDEIWISMEYLPGGTLKEMLQSITFEEKHVAYVIKKLLKTTAYIHSKEYIHRDLKTANIMLGENGEIYIIDFGLCAAVSKNKHGMVGSPFWMPPEMIQGYNHTTACDIWSLGIILLELAEGHPPNRHSAVRALFKIGIGCVPTFNEPEKWSDDCKSFLKKMLTVNPENRATAEELLKDPWLLKSEAKQGMITLFQHAFVEQSLNNLLM